MHLLNRILFGAGLLVAASLAQAAIVTLDGDHFTVSFDTSELGPYSGGHVSGSQDTVYFESTSFEALAPGGSGEPGVFLQLTLTIDQGYSFAGLSFVEYGNYYLFGDGSVRVRTGVTLANPAALDSVMLGLDTGTSLDALETLTPWQLSGAFGPGGLGDSQTLLITLDTTLFADATAGGAFIQNSYAGFQVLTESSAVPEPSSLVLVLAGMLAATLVGRRAVN